MPDRDDLRATDWWLARSDAKAAHDELMADRWVTYAEGECLPFAASEEGHEAHRLYQMWLALTEAADEYAARTEEALFLESLADDIESPPEPEPYDAERAEAEWEAHTRRTNL